MLSELEREEVTKLVKRGYPRLWIVTLLAISRGWRKSLSLVVAEIDQAQQDVEPTNG